jgi:excisionase family DNA binding protein
MPLTTKDSHRKQRWRRTLNEVSNADLLSVEQAARRLGTGERFVRCLVAERRIRFYKVGKYVRFHPDDLASFICEGRVEPIRPAPTYRRKG